MKTLNTQVCNIFYENIVRILSENLSGAFSRIHESRVVGLEHIQGLYDMSVRNLKKDIEQSGDSDLSNRIEIHHCDGRLGWPQESTDPIYDVIHVGAAAPEIPKHFFNQLRNGGRLILPGDFLS